MKANLEKDDDNKIISPEVQQLAEILYSKMTWFRQEKIFEDKTMGKILYISQKFLEQEKHRKIKHSIEHDTGTHAHKKSKSRLEKNRRKNLYKRAGTIRTND